MGSKRVVATTLAAVFALVSCNRDPNVAKRRYLESGNKYFDRGKYREAEIMYKNAKLKDPKYGLAYYKLGLTQIKLKEPIDAVQSFWRAISLIGPNQEEHWDSMVKVSEIFLLIAKDKRYLDEVDGYCKQLLQRDPNSFDGHRLTGDLNFVRATLAYRSSSLDEKAQAPKLLETAVTEYRRADAIKPGQQGLVMQLARALGVESKFAEAEQLYRGVIERNKTFPQAYSDLYGLLVVQGKLDEGEQVLRQAYQNNPKQYFFLIQLAQHYYGRSQRDRMIEVLNQIKGQAKDFPQAYVVVGDFYLRLGDGDSAIREYREGLSKEAKDSKRRSLFQKRMIEVFLRQNKRQEAADLNAQILRENPEDNDARGLEATFMLDRGDVEKALDRLKVVVTRAPDNAVARYNLGRAYVAHGDLDQARQQFEKAVELRPDYIAARLASAQIEVARGQFDAALKSAEKVLATDPGNINARLIESAALLGQRKFGATRELLDTMLKTNPNSPDVLYVLGVVNLAESKFKDAEEAFRRSYQLNPANSRGLMGMVETDMAQNKTDQALALLQAEADKNPARVDIRLQKGNLAAKAGRYDLAVDEFQKAVDMVPKGTKQQGDIYLRMGETYRRKGDYANALAALQKARVTLGDNVTVLMTLALSLESLGRWDEARQVYEATIKLDPNAGVALNNLAYGMAEHGGDLNQALTLAQRAKALLPNLSEVNDTMGWIYLKKALPEAAIDIFKDLVSKEPNHATFRYHLGMAYSQKGDKPRAVAELKEALKFNPSKPERDQIQGLLNKLL